MNDIYHISKCPISATIAKQAIQNQCQRSGAVVESPRAPAVAVATQVRFDVGSVIGSVTNKSTVQGCFRECFVSMPDRVRMRKKAVVLEDETTPVFGPGGLNELPLPNTGAPTCVYNQQKGFSLLDFFGSYIF